MKTLLTMLLSFLSLALFGEEYWLAFSQQSYNGNRGYYIQLVTEFPQEVIISNIQRLYIDTIYVNQTALHRIPDLAAKPEAGNPISSHAIKVTSEEPLQVLMINYDYLKGGMTVVHELQQLDSDYIILSETEGNADNISIIATQKTELFVEPSVNTNIATQPFTVNIVNGEVLYFKTNSYNTHGLSGTKITATQQHTGAPVPVAVFVNSEFYTNPNNNCCADDLDHQAIGIHYWGTEYLIPHILSKQGSMTQARYSDIKIIAKESNTQFYINNNLIILQSLEVFQFSTNQTTLIISTEPIRVTLITRGGDIDFTNADPFSINILPTKYSQEQTFVKPLRHQNIQDHYLIITHKLCNEFTLDNQTQNHTPYNDSLCTHYYLIDTSLHLVQGKTQTYQYSFGNAVQNYSAYGTELYATNDTTMCPQPTGIQDVPKIGEKSDRKRYNILGQEANENTIK